MGDRIRYALPHRFRQTQSPELTAFGELLCLLREFRENTRPTGTGRAVAGHPAGPASAVLVGTVLGEQSRPEIGPRNRQ